MATATTALSMEIPKMKYTIQDIQQNKRLWYKIHVFIYDLRNFNKATTSYERLESLLNASYIDGLYIGMPYFTPDEAAILRATVIQNGKTLQTIIRQTLEERLMSRIQKTGDSGDCRDCAARDLAQIFEKAFFVDCVVLERDTLFLALVAAFRLFLPGGREWDGLVSGKRKGLVWLVLGRGRGRW